VVHWWKVLRDVILVIIGLLAIVAGESDDSPGLQGLGLLLILSVAVFAYRRGRNQR
jgi:hypothetical protein